MDKVYTTTTPTAAMGPINSRQAINLFYQRSEVYTRDSVIGQARMGASPVKTKWFDGANFVFIDLRC